MKEIFRRRIDDSRAIVLCDDWQWYCLDAGCEAKRWGGATVAEQDMAMEIVRMREAAEAESKEGTGHERRQSS